MTCKYYGTKLNGLELSLLARPFTNRRNARLILKSDEIHDIILYSNKDIALIIDRPNQVAVVHEMKDKSEAIVEGPKSQSPRAQTQP